jgi:hypothetical protein
MIAWIAKEQPRMLATKNSGRTFGPRGYPGQILYNRAKEI